MHYWVTDSPEEINAHDMVMLDNKTCPEHGRSKMEYSRALLRPVEQAPGDAFSRILAALNV